MKEYIKMGIGFTIGLIFTLSVNQGFNDWYTKKKAEESKKPEESVTVTDDVA